MEVVTERTYEQNTCVKEFKEWVIICVKNDKMVKLFSFYPFGR